MCVLGEVWWGWQGVLWHRSGQPSSAVLQLGKVCPDGTTNLGGSENTSAEVSLTNSRVGEDVEERVGHVLRWVCAVFVVCETEGMR